MVDTIDLSIYISVPNAFTPNGDGQNDIIFPRVLGLKSIELKIYNRWGELVFMSDDANNGWDGKYKKIDQPVGTYVYYVKAKTLKGEDILLKGNIILIR